MFRWRFPSPKRQADLLKEDDQQPHSSPDFSSLPPSLSGRTDVSVAHHALGAAAQVLPHVRHQLVDALDGQRDVVLVGEAVVSERLGDALAHRPQSLRRRKWGE